MALFGLFGKKSEADVLRRHADKVANKRAQAVDRWESIQALARAGTTEAVEGLLPRFTFYVDPSITDQEEKDAAFQGVVDAGQEAVGPVVAFLRRAETIAWPLKMLEHIVDREVVVEKILALLAEMDTEYQRDPQRKIDLLAALEERPDPRTAETVTRFLEDANETVRFQAVGALLAQDDPSGQRDALIACLRAEESVRVRNRIFEGFAARGWAVGGEVEAVRAKLTAAYALDAKGVPVKKS